MVGAPIVKPQLPEKAMTQKLITSDGKRNITIDPRKIQVQAVKFAPPSYIRVCNASSKEPYRTPVWNVRESQAEEIASLGLPC